MPRSAQRAAEQAGPRGTPACRPAGYLVALFLTAAALAWPTESRGTSIVPWPAGASGARPGTTSPATDLYAEYLERAGIDASPQGAAAYLASMLPTPQRQALVAELVRQLGADDYQARERAMARLSDMALVPVEVLAEASRGDHREAAANAQKVLNATAACPVSFHVTAALHVLARSRAPGHADLLFSILPYCPDPCQQRPLRQALLATVRAGDEGALRRRLEGQGTTTAPADAWARGHAAAALGQVLGDAGETTMRGLLADSQPAVRLAAAQYLAQRGRREALTALAGLLDADDLAMRREADAGLRALTGRHFGFMAYDDTRARQVAAAAWKAWIARESAATALHSPPRCAPPLLGRTLICIYRKRRVIEIDEKQNQTFFMEGFNYNWGVQGLPNGHRLIVDANRDLVYEYDRDGREYWRRKVDGGGPTSVQRLDNGHTLLTLSALDTVVELDRAGKAAWEVKFESYARPTDAHRLDNGLTLVCLQNLRRVVEVDRCGRVLWKLEGLQNPYTVQRLPNGHTLVTDMDVEGFLSNTPGKVTEYDRQGQVVWIKDKLPNPCQAQRLPDGNTLIADNEGLHEFTPEGQEVWTYDCTRARFHRY